MESNNYESFITDAVEGMLPRFSDRNIVLTMKIRADWTDFGYDKDDGNTKIREESHFRKEIFLAFHRPSNYTKVLMIDIPTNRDLDEIDFRKKNNLPCVGTYQMKQLSDHDSCWRSDGMRWIFQSFCDAWVFFEENGIEGRDIHPMFSYSIFNGKPAYWLIDKMELVDPGDRWCGDYSVSFLKRISIKDISQYMQDTD
jgi:hypothetical protein